MEPRSELTASMVPSVRLLAPKLLIAGVLPIIGYALLRPHVSSDTIALAAVMVFPIAEISAERVRQGRFEPIGIIALIGIAVGLVGAAVLHGNALMLKVRESLLTGVFGVACLASLAGRRPVMFYLGRAFATGGDRQRSEEFDELWEVDGVPQRFRFVTTVWGLALVAEAAVRTALAVSIPTQTFLILAQIVNWTVLGALLWFTVRYSRNGERQILDALGDEPVPSGASVAGPSPG